MTRVERLIRLYEEQKDLEDIIFLIYGISDAEKREQKMKKKQEQLIKVNGEIDRLSQEIGC